MYGFKLDRLSCSRTITSHVKRVGFPGAACQCKCVGLFSFLSDLMMSHSFFSAFYRGHGIVRHKALYGRVSEAALHLPDGHTFRQFALKLENHVHHAESA